MASPLAEAVTLVIQISVVVIHALFFAMFPLRRRARRSRSTTLSGRPSR